MKPRLLTRLRAVRLKPLQKFVTLPKHLPSGSCFLTDAYPVVALKREPPEAAPGGCQILSYFRLGNLLSTSMGTGSWVRSPSSSSSWGLGFRRGVMRTPSSVPSLV